MIRIFKITYLFILMGVIFCTYPVHAQSNVLNIRHWAAPDHTRIVIDMSGDVAYTVEEAEKN